MIVKTGFWVALGLLVASIMAAYFTPQSIVYQRLAVVIGLVLAFSWLWTMLSIRKISVKRVARVFRMQLGQLFEERFEVSNNSRWVRVWFEIVDTSGLPGNSGSRVLSMIGPRRNRSYVARTVLLRRGAFDLGPTILSSGDPFGLFRYRVTIPAVRKLEVLPYFVELSNFFQPIGLLAGGQALRKKTSEITPYAAGIREYAPGDSLNRIHWKSTARRDQLMVKEFEQDPQADVWIFLDGLATVHVGSLDVDSEMEDPFWLWTAHRAVTIPLHTFEYAVSSAASIAAHYIRQGRSVGLVSAGQSFTVVPASRGERQLSKILETLTFLECKGQMPLEAIVQSQASQLTRGSTVVLITTANAQNLLVAVDELIRRDTKPVVVAVDTAIFGVDDNSEEIVDSLIKRGIPLKLVKVETNLRECLETTLR
jgi:uncharacterized protein (DUF58 family)